MDSIKRMTEEIKGKQAAYRIQEESRRSCIFCCFLSLLAVLETHNRVSLVNMIEIVVFFVFSIVQIFVVKRWFSGKKSILGL